MCARIGIKSRLRPTLVVVVAAVADSLQLSPSLMAQKGKKPGSYLQRRRFLISLQPTGIQK